MHEVATARTSRLSHCVDPPDDLRRRLLLSAGALPLASSLGVFAGFIERVAAAGVGEVAGYEPALQPDKSTLQRWLQQLHDFGPIRATGTTQCRAFEEWLASSLASSASSSNAITID